MTISTSLTRAEVEDVCDELMATNTLRVTRAQIDALRDMALLAATDQPVVQTESVVVPREPTEAMLRAGAFAAGSSRLITARGVAYDAYKAMIEAAPASSAPLAKAVLEYFGDEPDSTLKPAELRLRDMARESASSESAQPKGGDCHEPGKIPGVIEVTGAAHPNNAESAAVGALRELVRLKELKERWTRETEVDRVWISKEAREDYATNQPLAWEAARKIGAALNEPGQPSCIDCGLPYSAFPVDTTLPDDQWRLVHAGEHGLLCAGCIVKRAGRLPGIVAARMRLEFADQAGPAPAQRIIGISSRDDGCREEHRALFYRDGMPD